MGGGFPVPHDSRSLSPLVKPYVGFSPVRLSDDLPCVPISDRYRRYTGLAPVGVPGTLAYPAFPPPGFPSGRRLFSPRRTVGQHEAWTFAHVSSIASKGWRIHASFSMSRLGRSMALRSAQVLLSCPSSLQGHSDFPSAHNACLAGFIQLGLRLLPPDCGRNRGISGPLSRSLSPHAADLTPGPPQVLLPSTSLWTSAFPTNVLGRRIARSRGFIPLLSSPSYSRSISPHGAASFVFLLRPADLAGTPDWVRGAVSGQVPPGRYRPSAPSAYTPEKALGVMNSFQFTS